MKRKIYKPLKRKSGWLALALAGLLWVGSAQAQTPEEEPRNTKVTPGIQLSFHETGKLKFRLEVTQPLMLLHDNIDVFIMSDSQQIMYANKYSYHELRITTFDLSPLQDGTYSFVVRAGETRVSQQFDIKTKSKRVILSRD